MAINDFYRTSAVYTSPDADGEVVNVVDYTLTIVSTPLSEPGFCSSLASEVRQSIEALFLPAQGNTWTLERVDCFNITQPQFAGASPSGVVGGNALEIVSPRSAIVVSKKTGLRGRKFNGRMFLLAPNEVNQVNGSIISAYEAVIQLYVDDLIVLTDPISNQWDLVVYSSILLTGNLVTQMLVRSDLGSIRGRKKVTA